MKLGSEQHKQLFCQSFLDSQLDYKPENLPFPELDEMQLNRLKSIPFWREALTIEQEAGRMVSAFAETIDDPLIRKAIAVQGEEEKRHARLIKHLLDYYQIEVTPPRKNSELPDNIFAEFVKFGFSECLDSFFAFGMFGIARQVQYLPEVFFNIFDPILDEEARHIVFFVNWMTYHQINSGRGFPPLRGINTLLGYVNAIRDLIDSFGDVDLGENKDNENETNIFTASSANHFMADLTPQLFLSTCLVENKQRMAQFSEDLLQPQLFPRCSNIAYQVLKLMNFFKKSGETIEVNKKNSEYNLPKNVFK